MASSRIEMDDYENATKLEENQEIYEEIETAHEDIKKDPMLKIETAHGNMKKDPVLILSLKKWLQLVLLPLLIVSVLSISLILTVVYFSLYAELEEKLEKKYAFLMTKQSISATEIHAKCNDSRAELELKMEKKYEFLIAKQNATEIHALANEARVVVTGCYVGGGTVSAGSLKFPDIKTSIGVSDLSTFKSTGKFTCQVPGYYYVIVTMMSNSIQPRFDIMKNVDTIHWQYMTGAPKGWTPGTVAVALELASNDNVWIKLASSKNIYQSCLTIFKIN